MSSQPAGAYDDHHGDPDRDETPAQRIDRNFDELLQETRVIQTGIQVLFGFLLILPFQDRFFDLTTWQRTLYLVVLFLVALSTAFAVGPVVTHRLVFRRRVKDELIQASHRMAEASLAFLGLALIGGVGLVVDIVLGTAAGAIAMAALAAVIALTWLMTPFRILRNDQQD